MPEENASSRIVIETLTFDGGDCQVLKVVFGPHHFLEIARKDGKVRLRMGTTHHGFEADASEVKSQLEALIGEIREAHPDLAID